MERCRHTTDDHVFDGVVIEDAEDLLRPKIGHAPPLSEPAGAVDAGFKRDHIHQVLEPLVGRPSETFHDLVAIRFVGACRPQGTFGVNLSRIGSLHSPHDISSGPG
jgi:hypothetical protein